MSDVAATLERVSSIRGVRGALLVSAPDGLVVADSLMEGVDGPAVAALAASLVGRLLRTTRAAGMARPAIIHLRAEHGSVLAVPAGSDVLMVAVTAADANLGLARLQLLEAARELD
ncbi:MAG TPA: roadblock/LC7 domain-containing protein [Gemmatimonadales bacterium]|jgi:predicted regulator of Ras-like GTPase activity (Roadblock/LC7/MglB family)|nr:roadblock/LC7 domain-containing protein [Gemmatimonadales bacterium]